MAEAKGDGGKFKAHFRKAHAERLKAEHGLTVKPVTFDPPAVEDDNGALTYRDPSGRPLGPEADAAAGRWSRCHHPRRPVPCKRPRARRPAPVAMLDRRGGRWVLGNQGRVHMLMAAHSMNKIETLYATIFEGILGEKISTKPVEVVTPFPWINRRGKGG